MYDSILSVFDSKNICCVRNEQTLSSPPGAEICHVAPRVWEQGAGTLVRSHCGGNQELQAEAVLKEKKLRIKSINNVCSLF